MNEKPLNFALIGYGYWGPNLARVFSERPNVTLKTLCDKSDGRLAAAKSKYPRLETSSNLDDVLADPEIDAVIAATPVSTHGAIAKKALLAGKHVFVEKPMSMSSREATELLALAKKRKLMLMVGHTFLYSPPVQKVREILNEDTLGRIYYINSSRVNLGLFQPDVSVFWDLAPHDISIMLDWLDADPIWVRAEGSSFVRKQISEVGFATLGFPNNILAHLHVSWLAPVKMRQTTIVGSKRMLVYDDTSNSEKIKIYNHGVMKNPETFGEFQLTYRSGDIISPHVDTAEPLQNQAKAFIESIRTGQPSRSGPHFGLRVVKILEAIEKSVAQKGKVIKLA